MYLIISKANRKKFQLEIRYFYRYQSLSSVTVHGRGNSTEGIKINRIRARSSNSEGHNDLDEGFIDECESTHSNAKVLERSTSGSQDIAEQQANISAIQPENLAVNKALLKSARKAFR